MQETFDAGHNTPSTLACRVFVSSHHNSVCSGANVHDSRRWFGHCPHSSHCIAYCASGSKTFRKSYSQPRRTARLEPRRRGPCSIPGCPVRLIRNSSSSKMLMRFRFSVKEAAYKALYPTVRPTWKELSYTGFGKQPPGSKPILVYEPPILAMRDKIGQLHVSVSHDGEYVASTVIVETP